MRIQVGQLDSQQIGRKISIRPGGDVEVRGTIAAVQHMADIITDKQLGSRDEERALGAPYVRVVLLEIDGAVRLWPEHVVEVTVP